MSSSAVTESAFSHVYNVYVFVKKKKSCNYSLHKEDLVWMTTLSTALHCMTFVKYTLHFPYNNQSISLFRDCRCCCACACVSFVYEFLILCWTHWVVNCLFGPLSITFLHWKIIIFYCKFLSLLPWICWYLVSSCILYSLSTVCFIKKTMTLLVSNMNWSN